GWPQLREEIAAAFRRRTRDEWEEIFAGTDACVTPVLTPEEAAEHPHMRARDAFVEIDGVRQPAPAPRFSRTPGAVDEQRSAGVATLADWGFTQDELSELHEKGAVACRLSPTTESPPSPTRVSTRFGSRSSSGWPTTLPNSHRSSTSARRWTRCSQRCRHCRSCCTRRAG